MMNLIRWSTNLLKRNGNPFGQIVRYVISGGIASIADIGIMILLTEILHIEGVISATIGNAVGLIITYLLSIFWIFNERKLKNPLPEFLLFAIIGAGATLFTFLLMSCFVNYLHLHYILAKIMTIVLVSAYSFVVKKRILFRK